MGLLEIAFLVGIGFVIAKVVEYGKDKSRDYAKRETYLPPPTEQREWSPPVIVERSETEEINFRSGTGTPPPQQQLSPEVRREKELTELKRRYVADEITVEQYEAELDRIMRGGRS